MQLDSIFSVVAPIDEVWATIMDFERVAGCVPGAQILNKLSEDAYQVGIQVKLGPVTMQYKGMLTVLERDADAHKAVFEGKAQETRGQGTAQGTGSLVLVQDGDTTRGTVSAEIALSGKVAVMGKSVIGSVTDQMMGLFAENLQAMIAAPAAGQPVADGAAAGPAGPPERSSAAGGAPSGTSRPAPAAAPTAETSLNAISLAQGLIAEKLSEPKIYLAVLGTVAFVAYRVGKMAGRRSSR